MSSETILLFLLTWLSHISQFTLIIIPTDLNILAMVKQTRELREMFFFTYRACFFISKYAPPPTHTHTHTGCLSPHTQGVGMLILSISLVVYMHLMGSNV